MNAPLELDWTTSNQHLLVAEFARLRALLGDGELAAAERQIDAMTRQMPAPAAIDTLVALFQLSDFERDILLLVAGVEMDARLASLCVANLSPGAGGHAHAPWANFGLALGVLPEAHWSALTPVAALRRWRLIEVDETAGLSAGRLRLDERVLHFIAGLNYLDHRLRPLLDPVPPAGLMAEPHRALAARIGTELRTHGGRLPVVMLSGDDREGQRDVAATLADALGVTLFQLRAADIPTAPHEQAALASLWQREAALLGSGLLIIHGEDDSASHAAALARFVPRIDGLLVLAGPTAPRIDTDSLHHPVDKPDAPGQRRLWHTAMGDRAGALGTALDGLASQYRLGARQIARCAAQIGGADAAQDIATLHRLSRSDARGIGELAQAIDARAGWDDLILPDAQRRALQQIAVHARHRITVHHDWGFADKGSRGLGIATLFSGESGTGKTLAAEVLANTLGLALYRIDLSAVISKYIGETEKNLRKVFDGA